MEIGSRIRGLCQYQRRCIEREKSLSLVMLGGLRGAGELSLEKGNDCRRAVAVMSRHLKEGGCPFVISSQKVLSKAFNIKILDQVMMYI